VQLRHIHTATNRLPFAHLRALRPVFLNKWQEPGCDTMHVRLPCPDFACPSPCVGAVCQGLICEWLMCCDDRQLIAEHYPWFLETYDALPKNIMRADAVRRWELIGCCFHTRHRSHLALEETQFNTAGVQLPPNDPWMRLNQP